ncbi:MAG: rnc [Anaerophaga sp.]|uniref:ribonuclease III n=1 Tax=Anaerophaga thermohalophila TaxID=177400 RepID=UPI000237C0AE|nr:ribonuclease III [Anaerophaga thermohalophila]MBZ4675887.1 rnc [Anaerophaga sp.]MDI3520494.1 ribonuclease [Anaerophaga sp.]MDK2842243.1 ribonuclease [Anaerophaga sp.]MDN5291173.1 ribonuclease [Anaerophaga sp.]
MFIPLFKSIKLFSRKGRKFYKFINSITGIRPGNIDLYHQAVVHKSVIRRNRRKPFNNERLEYLGDAILGAVVAQELYLLYPNEDEGFLTKTRSRIVSRANLNQIALDMGLQEWIQFHPPGDISQTHILGDALEAIIGAIFLDKGYGSSRKFIRNRILTKYLDLKQIVENDTNYKSILIEWGQKNKHPVHFITEEYPVTEDNGPVFIARAIVNEKISGMGTGNSKKEAEQKAANEALENVQTDTPS